MCFKTTINTANYCRGMNSMSSWVFAKLGNQEERKDSYKMQNIIMNPCMNCILKIIENN